MTIKVEEFRGYLEIDKLALDDGLRHQPSLLFHVSDEYEQALAERDNAKDELARVDAALDEEIRDTFGKDKYTESQVKSLILNEKAHLNAHKVYAVARQRCGQLSALKDAFKERGNALRKLADLYIANYYETNSSRPTADTDRVIYEANKAKMHAARNR